MVSPRFLNLLLILICLLLRFSTAEVKMMTISTPPKLQTDRSPVNVQEQMQQGVTSESRDGRRRLGGRGREMESGRVTKLMESQHWNAEASSITDDKVHHCIETCEFKGFEMPKFSKRSRRHHSMRVKMSGFVSWNADYHVPRPHPPKNN